jgi:hypothetical protein
MLASRPHRLRHHLWHSVRNAWSSPGLTPQVRQRIIDAGWSPPNNRASLDADGKPILDNYSGEDFLFMHREMIREVNEALAKAGDPFYPRVIPWDRIPGPGDSGFPLPPAWNVNNPGSSLEENRDATLGQRRAKSSDFYENTIRPWELVFTSRSTLRRMTLSQLGSMLEFTIHNSLHNRFASEPTGYRPDGSNPDDPVAPIWDTPEYDYLGDTYSSHVNPVFWFLHGWVDSCIDRWFDSNGIEPNIYIWTGTWTGKLEASDNPMRPLHALLAVDPLDAGAHHHHGGSLDEMAGLIRDLKGCGVIRNFYHDLLNH